MSRVSEYEIQHQQRNDEEQYRHDAAGPQEVGYLIITGSHYQGINLVSRDQEGIGRRDCHGQREHGGVGTGC